MSTRPVLILNPRNDAAFVQYAESLLNGSTDPASLQARLRERYPIAAVRPRDLSSERTSIWYVYRDGHWVPNPGVERADVTETGDDLRATSEAIAADAERLREVEEQKQALPEGHPALVELSEEAERLARGLVPKTAAELDLAIESVGGSGGQA